MKSDLYRTSKTDITSLYYCQSTTFFEYTWSDTVFDICWMYQNKNSRNDILHFLGERFPWNLSFSSVLFSTWHFLYWFIHSIRPYQYVVKSIVMLFATIQKLSKFKRLVFKIFGYLNCLHVFTVPLNKVSSDRRFWVVSSLQLSLSTPLWSVFF